jgi:hypothetical protein
LEEELISTSKGNLPLKDLVHKHGFAFMPNSITFWEEYFLGEESVKRNVYGYVLPFGTKMELRGGDIA